MMLTPASAVRTLHLPQSLSCLIPCEPFRTTALVGYGTHQWHAFIGAPHYFMRSFSFSTISSSDAAFGTGPKTGERPSGSSA